MHQVQEDAVVEVWSANRLEQFRRAGFPRRSVARPLADESPHRTASLGPPPRIVSPQSAPTYYIQNHAPQQNRLLLEAHAAPRTEQIHWFADRRYLGASAPAEPLAWQPAVGDYDLQAMDDAGRVASTRISVRLAIGN